MKKLTKLLSIALGALMSIGVAIGVKQTAEMVNAGSATYAMTIDSSENGNNNVHWINSSITSLTYDDVTWTTSVTGTSSFTASKTYVQIGSKNNPATKVTISTTAFAGKKITFASLTGYCMTNTGPSLTVTAGSTKIITSAELVKTTSTEYKTTDSFAGVTLGSTDALTYTINSSAKAAICISEIKVIYETSSDESNTLDAITDISATISAKVGDDEWTIKDASATGIVSGVSNQDVTNMVDFSVETDVPDAVGQTNVTLRATKKDSIEGDATYFEKTILATVNENPFASFTKVTDVDDVSSSCVYALSNDGKNFVGNSINNGTLAYPATDYEDVGFFKLLNNGGLQLVTYQDGAWSGATDAYVNNASSTNLSFGSESSQWEAKEDSSNGVYLINNSNSKRHLGLNEGATGVKAYASTNIDKNLPVYLYGVYKEYYTVRFYNDGVQYGTDVEVLEGKKLTKPADPSKENYTFVGWEDADGNLWDFDNDTVDSDDVDADGVMILTSVWNDNAEAALQNDLNSIRPWMSLAYQYTDTRLLNNITIGISDSHEDEASDCNNNTEKNLTSAFANDVGISFVWNSGSGKNWWFKENDLRLYKGNTLTISAGEGQFIQSVTVKDRNGQTISANLNISSVNGSAVLSCTDTIKYITSFDIEYGSGGFTDVDFRIKMAIDDMSDLAEEHSVTEYGVEISDGTTTRSYAFGDATRTSTDTNGTKQYVIIGLGDVFAHPERLQAVFSLKAYAVLNGKKLYSTNVKQHSVVSLVESYHGMSDYSDLVDSLYQYFVSVGLIDED